jgi:hypothetical protein
MQAWTWSPALIGRNAFVGVFPTYVRCGGDTQTTTSRLRHQDLSFQARKGSFRFLVQTLL